jgi:hypothetical protein
MVSNLNLQPPPEKIMRKKKRNCAPDSTNRKGSSEKIIVGKREGDRD